MTFPCESFDLRPSGSRHRRVVIHLQHSEDRQEANPIKLVRQSAKRERTPEVLELAELQLLLSKLSVRERTLALLDAATGLRVSELLALRWSDVDFENLELRVTRSLAPSGRELQNRSIRHPFR